MKYTINNSSIEDINNHFNLLNPGFKSELETKVNLKDYSTKIFNNAVRFEYFKDNSLVGLIAMYQNKEKIGYITHVGVAQSEQLKGLASKLLTECINYSRDNSLKEINLEVNCYNFPAISLYKKFGFVETKEKEDSLFMNLNLNKEVK